MTWVKKILGIEDNPNIQEQRETMGSKFRNFVNNLFPGTNIYYETPPEKLQQDAQEVQRMIAERGGDVVPQQVTQTPQTLLPADNPYAAWTEEQKKAGIRPDVLSYAESTLTPEFKSRGIPPALGVSQWAVEGGREIKDNPFGLMRNNEVLNYGALQDNIRAYDETLRDIITTNMGISPEDFRYEDYTPEELLYFLQFQKGGASGKKRYEAHMENPQNYIDMITNMPEWRYYR